MKLLADERRASEHVYVCMYVSEHVYMYMA